MNRRLRWGVYAAVLMAILVPAHSSASEGTDDLEETVAIKVSQLREARAKWRAVGLARLATDSVTLTPLPFPLPPPTPDVSLQIEALSKVDVGKGAYIADQIVLELDTVLRETVSCAFEAGLSFEEVQ